MGGKQRTAGISGGLTTDSCWMSHHVTRGRQLAFGTSSPAAETGASKSPGVPLGIIIRCFIAALFSRRLKIGGPESIRQGN
jgi:hypothetical protein